MAFVDEVTSPPRSHLSILRGKGSSDREYSSEHFIPSLHLLHHTPLKSHFTSSWSVGFTWAAAVAAGQVYPGSIWPRWAVELLRSVPATSCLHRVGQCQKAAQSFWSMCNAGSVRGSHPMSQTLTNGMGVGGAYYPLPSLGQTILSTFYQLPRGPSGLEPTYSVVFRSMKPSAVGFSSFPVSFSQSLLLFLRITS